MAQKKELPRLFTTDGEHNPSNLSEVNPNLKHTIGDSIPPAELKIVGYTLTPPERLNIGLEVWINFWSASVIGEIISIHEYPEQKFKYDLKVIAKDGLEKRIYNVDGEMLTRTHPRLD